MVNINAVRKGGSCLFLTVGLFTAAVGVLAMGDAVSIYRQNGLAPRPAIMAVGSVVFIILDFGQI